MKKPLKSEFNFDRRSKRFLNWKDEYDYKKALQAYENRERKSGRTRTRQIHDSWKPYLPLFDSSSFYRSQGAFCRASGVKRATFSGALCRQISVEMAEKISAWAEDYALQIHTK